MATTTIAPRVPHGLRDEDAQFLDPTSDGDLLSTARQRWSEVEEACRDDRQQQMEAARFLAGRTMESSRSCRTQWSWTGGASGLRYSAPIGVCEAGGLLVAFQPSGHAHPPQVWPGLPRHGTGVRGPRAQHRAGIASPDRLHASARTRRLHRRGLLPPEPRLRGSLLVSPADQDMRRAEPL